VLGQDAFATLPIWYRWQSLLDFCNLIVVERPGDTRKEPEPVQSLCLNHEVEHFDAQRIGQIHRLRIPMKEISATQIRQKIAAGENVEHLLAPPVYAYIKQHRLYVNTENAI
jgi:nicotinate-nucleotide adenylyltransferase